MIISKVMSICLSNDNKSPEHITTNCCHLQQINPISASEIIFTRVSDIINSVTIILVQQLINLVITISVNAINIE